MLVPWWPTSPPWILLILDAINTPIVHKQYTWYTKYKTIKDAQQIFHQPNRRATPEDFATWNGYVAAEVAERVALKQNIPYQFFRPDNEYAAINAYGSWGGAYPLNIFPAKPTVSIPKVPKAPKAAKATAATAATASADPSPPSNDPSPPSNVVLLVVATEGMLARLGPSSVQPFSSPSVAYKHASQATFTFSSSHICCVATVDVAIVLLYIFL